MPVKCMYYCDFISTITSKFPEGTEVLLEFAEDGSCLILFKVREPGEVLYTLYTFKETVKVICTLLEIPVCKNLELWDDNYESASSWVECDEFVNTLLKKYSLTRDEFYPAFVDENKPADDPKNQAITEYSKWIEDHWAVVFVY